MNNLALVLNNQGDYKKAEQIYREVLALMERELGKEHPLTLNSMNNLASVLRSARAMKDVTGHTRAQRGQQSYQAESYEAESLAESLGDLIPYPFDSDELEFITRVSA